MISYKINVNDAVQGLDRLKLRKQINAIKYALRKASKPIVTTTRANMRSRFNPNKEQIYSVKTTVAKSGEYAKVSIARSKALRWLEHGTKDRKTKKNYSRGKLQSLHFFTDAISATSAQVQQILIDALTEKIGKI